MGYHVAKKHAQPSSKKSTFCSSCEQELPGYYSLQQHGTKQQKASYSVTDLNKTVKEEVEDGEILNAELSACQHFLVDTKMENWRHKVFKFQMSKLDSKIINEKLEEVFNKLDSAALLWVLFFEMLRLMNIDISTPMKTILCLKDPT